MKSRALKDSLSFREVLPSSLGVLVLGAVLSTYQDWSWYGNQDQSAWILGILIGFVLYFLGFKLSKALYYRIPSVKDLLEMLVPLFKRFTWPQIIIVSVLAGLGEELLMRAVLQSWLSSLFSPLVAIVLTAIVFGLLHFVNITYVLVTFVIGIVFGVIFYITESLLVVVVAHTIYDICALTVIVKYPHWLNLDRDENRIRIVDSE